ncbi:DUF4167 domain-containing protein [Paracoccus sp. (in: a-proteobacteria)]|uniref:DUF4167 domain-containing protein n=1 Tax=Paracoccus sp. TaxID=267 RepID=UPI003A862E81
MRSSKSRSRNKSNRQRSLGNIVNRVFDSSGPEGKVRGTPQQIIDKYLTLARDAQLSNDRVAEQSFLQHAEHYTRMLGEAQREMAERQQQHQNNNHQQRHNGDDDRDPQGGRDQQQGGRNNGLAPRGDAADEGSNRVDTSQDRAEPRAFAEAAASEGEQPQPEHSRRPRQRRNSPERAEAPAEQPVKQIEMGLPDAVASESRDGLVDTPEREKPAAKSPRAKSAAPRAPRSATGRTRRKPKSEDEAGPQSEDAGNGTEQA